MLVYCVEEIDFLNDLNKQPNENISFQLKKPNDISNYNACELSCQFSIFVKQNSNYDFNQCK